MKEHGQVIETQENIVVVEMKPRGGCKSCSMNTICKETGKGMRQLSLSAGGGTYKPGDWVEIETKPGGHLAAGFIIFIFPLIAGFLFWLIANQLFSEAGWSIPSFFAGFGLSLCLIYLFDKRYGKRKIFTPVITKKISR